MQKGEPSSFDIYVPISKLDEEQQIVFGWGLVNKVGTPTGYTDTNGEHLYKDLQDDLVEDYELEKAVYDFMLTPMHDEMHEHLVPTSKVVESIVVTTEKLQKMFEGEIPEGKRGWWLGVKIFDPDVYAKHKDGTYKGFSITGTASRMEV